MFNQPPAVGWEATLETDSLETENVQAGQPEAVSAATFKEAVETVGQKSDICHQLMIDRPILADEASFIFKDHTRSQRLEKILEIDHVIMDLEQKLAEAPVEEKEHIKTAIRAEQLNKIKLVLEQAYADITYLMTRREVVAKLSEEMLIAAKSGAITKDQVNNLILEAKELQKLYASMGVSSAEAKQLIEYFRLEFKTEAIPVLAALTAETETFSDMAINISDADRIDFSAKFGFWLDQLVKFDLHANIELLTEVHSQMPAELKLKPDDAAETVADAEAAGGASTVANFSADNQTDIAGWDILQTPKPMAEMADPATSQVVQIPLEASRPNDQEKTAQPDQLSQGVIRILLGISGRNPTATVTESPVAIKMPQTSDAAI